MRAKFSLLSGLCVGQVVLVGCMPTLEHLAKYVALNPVGLQQRTAEGCPHQEVQEQLPAKLEKRLLVDLLTTPIDVSGIHEFTPPDFAAGDVRGPCPGLNALANHGYLPHSGVAPMLDALTATNTVLGMGIDLSTFLSVFATAMVGDVVSLNPAFSVGGATPAVLDILGVPQGLDGSHNFIEGDSSPTRGDLYQIGNNYQLQLPNFMDLYNLVDDPNGDYSMDVLLKHSQHRYQQSVSQNPYFYYGPLTGMIFRNAGYAFMGRMFANYSIENPTGILTKETLKSFFAISGPEDNLVYNEGWEQIPQNWYRTPLDYTQVSLVADITAWMIEDPSIANLGGNTGTTNSFAGIDLADLTGGVYTASNLLENNNLMCFALEVVKFVSPNSLSSLYTKFAQALAPLTNAISGPLAALACPEIHDLTVGGKPASQALLTLYPGAGKSGQMY